MAKPTPFASGRRGVPLRRSALEPAAPQRFRVSGATPSLVELRGPRTRAGAQCERVLRSLPDWFEVDAAIVQYGIDSTRYPTFAVWNGKAMIGFGTVRRHYGSTWELHCLAIHADWLRRGVGTRLVRRLEGWVRRQGGRFLQVKTVGPSHPSREYRSTRAFYSRLGYEPLEEFHGIWGPRCPCLQLIKYLGR
ncbi:MAG TPA: GNAT family N-acetyltransferase [Burkholderiaceae bacterium]|nr:GNAT family N-acetyltransferase [Burkholderiaceae bacterium]